MYYQNYDDYMRDVFYFNQMPNQNMMNQNMSYSNMQNNMNSCPNNNNLYPSIYRIVQPVVSRVVTGSNFQCLTEDTLNTMVDTIYNIVEGDVMSMNETDNTVSTVAGTNNSNSKVQSVNANAVTKNCDNNKNATVLLKDLIKILVLKEVANRNTMRRFQMNNQMYPNQFCPNYSNMGFMF